MPEEWSASGARLPLSLEVRFTGEPVAGGDLRWSVEEPSCCPAKRLLASPATFVGPEGAVTVAVGAGGWLAEPADRCGRSALRFYLDFPDGARRNGASLPKGRVFFRAACWVRRQQTVGQTVGRQSADSRQLVDAHACTGTARALPFTADARPCTAHVLPCTAHALPYPHHSRACRMAPC